MPSIFTRIITGEIPGTFVWEDEVVVAFLSINPLRPGHTLVVPREEIDHWIDCPDDLTSHLMTVARRIGAAQMRAFSPNRVGLMVVGDEVPHVHLHVVPIRHAGDLDFRNAAATVTREELEDAAELIRSNLGSTG